MDLHLKDATVFVTGSSAGIGQATAIAYGAEGARVAVTYYKNRQGAEETAKEVQDRGGQALIVHYDLADPDSIRSSIEQIQKEWGTLNVLVNNAAPMDVAGPTGQLFEDVPIQNWESMIRRTLEGAALTIQCALPLMRKSGWGRILNISSDGTDGWPGLGPYATAKSGLHGLTRTLAAELGPANIVSNVVMPGAVMTERTAKNIPAEQKEQIRQHMPTRQLITPEDVAAVIVFLGSPMNKQIIGEIIRVTGGR
ncbi:MAG TPA: SDR family oxidoreductase [Anaerolineales bacterium]|nr:SDR family oxidoreductase [Anaerolineales bacterium]